MVRQSIASHTTSNKHFQTTDACEYVRHGHVFMTMIIYRCIRLLYGSSRFLSVKRSKWERSEFHEHGLCRSTRAFLALTWENCTSVQCTGVQMYSLLQHAYNRALVQYKSGYNKYIVPSGSEFWRSRVHIFPTNLYPSKIFVRNTVGDQFSHVQGTAFKQVGSMI